MTTFKLGRREIGAGKPVFVVAEMSANHQHNLARARAIVKAAAECGADAVKIQTYTADTLTISSDNPFFKIKGTLWDGRTLYDLYREAEMPWEWYPILRDDAESLGMEFFSTPFDQTAVDFLSGHSTVAYKIASFELVDIPLIRYVARKGRPIIMSTGMATEEEISEAVSTVYAEGNQQLVLLKCTSAYPASVDDMNLRTISDMASRFRVPIGLSDHTLDSVVAVAAVALGACLIEKHFTMTRADGGPDGSFSMEPGEFGQMVNNIRSIEKALGKINYELTDGEKKSVIFRKSLFVVKDVKAGERLTAKNLRCIRPGYGMHPRYYEDMIGRNAACDIKAGTPLAWEMINK